jgi:hypothetical protein
MNDQPKKEKSDEQSKEAELEYYDLTHYTATDKERDHFFDTLSQEEGDDEDLSSRQPPIRLDRFYREEDEDNDD